VLTVKQVMLLSIMKYYLVILPVLINHIIVIFSHNHYILPWIV
jgi:hypothetical protein